MATKAAAQRAGKTKVVARGSTPPKSKGTGAALGMGSPLGVNARVGGMSTPGNTNTPSGNPTFSTPAPMAAVTPIAAPPVVTDPFLTPTDLANQAIEIAGVTDYLNGVDLQTANARTQAQQNLGDVDTAEGRNVESNDWNTAARGLAQSSIRDTNRANIQADAERARTATKGNLANAEDYGTKAHANADTNVLPAIGQKYAGLAKQNAEAATDNTGDTSGDTGPQPTGAGGPQVLSSTPQANTVAPGAGTIEAQWTPVVKDGKFYHYYPAMGGQPARYVFIRNAG